MKQSFYIQVIAFFGIKTSLAVTTGLIGFAIGTWFANDNYPGAWLICGIIGGLLLSLSVDGVLDGLMANLLNKWSERKFKLAVLMSLLSGGASIWSAFIIGDSSSNEKGIDDEIEMIDDAEQKQNSKIVRIENLIRTDSSKLADLEIKEQELIDNQNEWIQERYKAGDIFSPKWDNRSKYITLGEVRDQLTIYKNQRTILQANDTTNRSLLLSLLSSDVSIGVEKKVETHNIQERLEAEERTLIIRVFDIVMVILLWVVFFQLKEMKENGVQINVKSTGFIVWLFDSSVQLYNIILERVSPEVGRGGSSIIIHFAILSRRLLGLFSLALYKINETLRNWTEKAEIVTELEESNDTQKKSVRDNENEIDNSSSPGYLPGSPGGIPVNAEGIQDFEYQKITSLILSLNDKVSEVKETNLSPEEIQEMIKKTVTEKVQNVTDRSVTETENGKNPFSVANGKNRTEKRTFVRKCNGCNGRFQTDRENKKYCSNKCRSKAYRERKKKM